MKAWNVSEVESPVGTTGQWGYPPGTGGARPGFECLRSGTNGSREWIKKPHEREALVSDTRPGAGDAPTRDVLSVLGTLPLLPQRAARGARARRQGGLLLATTRGAWAGCGKLRVALASGNFVRDRPLSKLSYR